MSEENKNRKIPLDVDTYNVLTGVSYGGNKECDHDYPPEPTTATIYQFPQAVAKKFKRLRSHFFNIWLNLLPS